jgi:amidase
LNNEIQNAQLVELLKLMRGAGAIIINGTELPNYETTVSPNGWNWDYGSTRGYPNESEYTVVKVDVWLLLPNPRTMGSN